MKIEVQDQVQYFSMVIVIPTLYLVVDI